MSIATANRSSHPFDSAAGAGSSSSPDLTRAEPQNTPLAGRVSRVRLWTGRVLTALVTLFLLFDGAAKLVMPLPVVQAMTRLGIPVSLAPAIGILLLICTALYVIPRTAVLGSILITGFLGGAVAIQMRAGSPRFETLFPVIFGVLVWSGIYLRESRLGIVFPLRRSRNRLFSGSYFAW